MRGPETYPRPLCCTCGVRVSLPIPIPTLQCCALPKLAVYAVSLSMCITCSASLKLMVLILCSLSVYAPGCAPFSFSLLRSAQPRFLAHFNTWITSISTALVQYVWSSCFTSHSHFPVLCSAEVAVYTVSLSMCIMCSASPKLTVMILCSLSVCTPGSAHFSISISLLRVLLYGFLSFNTWQGEQLSSTLTTMRKCVFSGSTPPTLLMAWSPELQAPSRQLKVQGSWSRCRAFPGC